MKKIIAVLAMALISQLSFGQNEKTVIDLNSEEHLVKNTWLPCPEKDFFTVACSDKCGMHTNIGVANYGGYYSIPLKNEWYQYVIKKCANEYEPVIGSNKAWIASDPYGTGDYELKIINYDDYFIVRMEKIEIIK